MAYQVTTVWSAWTGSGTSLEKQFHDPTSPLGRDSIVGFICHHTAPDDIIATTDAGFTSFWSQRRVINLDGLINNFDYQRRLARGELAQYLKENRVRYLIVGWWPREQPFRRDRSAPMYRSRINPAVVAGRDYQPAEFYVYSYQYETFSDHILLCPGQEAYRSQPSLDGMIEQVIVIYDLTRPCR